jgi:cellobiose-specific phosphotransferase system component IIB
MAKYLAIALALLCAAGIASADMKVVQKVSSKVESDINPMANGTSEHTETIWFKGKKARIDADNDKEYKLADFEKGEVLVVNPEEKTYSKMTFKDLAKLRDVTFYQIQKQLEQFDKLEPEQKAMTEMMYGPKIKKLRDAVANKDKETKVEVKTVEETKDIAGHSCKHIVVEEEGTRVLDLWMTEDVKVEVDLAEVLASMALFSPSVKKKVKELKGYSLKTVYVFDIVLQKITNSSETTEIKTDEIPDDKFALPEEYKQVDSDITRAIKQYDEWVKSQKKEEEKKESEEQEKGLLGGEKEGVEKPRKDLFGEEKEGKKEPKKDEPEKKEPEPPGNGG